ncbi:MAG: c-type cytochrome [Acidobacteriaceae bacterium]|nr:c-type cytochrome [Acidobacteriaceae bacterium]MBV9763267.1 c-type cytochrome [Acidobacteriaceae bacterium]
MKLAGLLVAFALFCGGHNLLAQDADDIRQQQANAASTSAGKTLFQQNCGFCHGPDARGASGPDLIRSTLVSHDENGKLIGPVVRSGRPEKGMPAFPFSDAQILQIADFLHSEAKIASTIASRVPTEYPLEKLLVGNADAGKAFFASNCVQCHSPIGDLAHVASKYKPIDLQSRIAFPSGRAPTVTVTDSAGRKFTGDQAYSDEFVISLRDRNGWIQSWNRNRVDVKVNDPLAAHVKLLTIYTDKNVHDLFAYLETLK